jgi:hypothetical protein
MSLSLVDTIKILINTCVRLIPLGLYTGSVMAGVVFQDFRGVLLFLGFLGNELISLGYRLTLHGVINPQCALTFSTEGTPFVLPSPLAQTVGFFAGFFFMDMYYNNMFNTVEFFLLTIMQIFTIYSRVNVGCKTLLDAIYCALIGNLLGIIYYNLVQPYYKADFLAETITVANDDINSFFSIS